MLTQTHRPESARVVTAVVWLGAVQCRAARWAHRASAASQAMAAGAAGAASAPRCSVPQGLGLLLAVNLITISCVIFNWHSV